MEQSQQSASRMSESWREKANCAGADAKLFFPDKRTSTKEARQLCRECSVLDQCREYALANCITHGIWGGLSERQRRMVRKERKQTELIDATSKASARSQHVA